jgi:hypothetical protein
MTSQWSRRSPSGREPLGERVVFAKKYVPEMAGGLSVLQQMERDVTGGRHLESKRECVPSITPLSPGATPRCDSPTHDRRQL